jgi:enamine deaminase RidA (YjgF/YER057c/UK114 family)
MAPLQERLAELGLTLPEPVPVRGRFRSVVVRGDLAFASGALATTGPPLQVAWPGAVGADVSLEDAMKSAEGAVLALLANVNQELDGLERVEGILHVHGYVQAAPGFDKVHHVVGAATRLVGELFGDDGLPARTAVGVATLPESASVVLDAIVAITGGGARG